VLGGLLVLDGLRVVVSTPPLLFLDVSTRVRVYPTDAVLPADGFLLSADAVKTTSARTRKK
jgi:hypothetical protein